MSCGRGNGELTGKPKYHAPHEYGVDPGQARNLRLNSSGVAIGAWHNLPRSLYLEHVRDGVVPDAVYEQALVEYPTVVYLHGNALNRAAPFRVRSYQEISEVLNANVIAIDYRGFGDSESFPTEEGVVLDARAAVQFVLDHARRPDRTGPAPGLTLMGQSLGTGVAAQCALRLFREGIHVDGVVLLAAFSSLRPLVAAFRMGGLVPLLGWLDYVPFKEEILDNMLHYSFDTQAAISELVGANARPGVLRPPTVVDMHTDDDDVIPPGHGNTLLDAAIAALDARNRHGSFQLYLTAVADLARVTSVMHKQARKPTQQILEEGARANLPRGAPFTLVQLERGGHNHILDGNMDLIKLMLPKNMQA